MSKFGTILFRHAFESGDEKRMKKLQQDLSDLTIIKDIAYIDDNNQGHLLDIYELKDICDDAFTMINIHGGGLFASYKEVNANFNYELARRGYRTVSISYRRIPDVTLKMQINDVLEALRFVYEKHNELGINLEHVYLTGDSAGALLAFYVLCINGSKELQNIFDEKPVGFAFDAAGFISIMLDTQRKDLMKCISDMVLKKAEKNSVYAEYILNPITMLKYAKLPPCFLVTGAQDLIEKDTLKLADGLNQKGFKYKLMQFGVGKERKLDHVFAVKFPKWPESRDVIEKMIEYFSEGEYHE